MIISGLHYFLIYEERIDSTDTLISTHKSKTSQDFQGSQLLTYKSNRFHKPTNPNPLKLDDLNLEPHQPWIYYPIINNTIQENANPKFGDS